MFGLAILATLVGAVAAVVSSGGSSSSGGGSGGTVGTGNSSAGGSNASTATSGNTTGQNNSSWDVAQDSVPSPGVAQYPKINEFVSFSLKNEDYSPSYTNLWSFHIATPPILQNVIGFNEAQVADQQGTTQNTVGQPGGNFVAELGNLRNALNYYCQTVNVPSRQVTTGGLVNIGAGQNSVPGYIAGFPVDYAMDRDPTSGAAMYTGARLSGAAAAPWRSLWPRLWRPPASSGR